MNTNVLKYLRLFHRISSKELAAKIDCSQSYLSGLESGKRPITLKVLEKYSMAFNVPVSDLMIANEKLSSKEATKPQWLSTFMAWVFKGEECAFEKVDVPEKAFEQT
jgi:transcriptional regulator with XRE-family HTH domain